MMGGFALRTLILLLVATGAARAVSQFHQLTAFNNIVLCVPFNVAIRPASTPGVRVDADDAVNAALQPTVSNAQLVLSISKDFDTRQPIRVYIELLDNALRSVSVQGVGSVWIAPGFKPQSLTINAVGTGDVFAPNVVTDSLTVYTSGTGDVSVGGNIGAAQLTADGTTTVHIVNLKRGAKVNANGIGDIALGMDSDSAVINGAVQGIRTVFYDRGTCNLESGFLAMFNSVCEQVQKVVLTASKPTFTCGLRARGTSNACGTRGGTSGSGFASSSSYSSGSNAADPQVIARSTPGSSGVAAASLPCTSTDNNAVVM